MNVTGSDAAPSSGIASFDIYVAVDNGPLTFDRTVSATSSGTASFSYTGQDSHLYWFRSIARDKAGNTESKPAGADASTYVPDLTVPVTQVGTVNTTNPLFQIPWSGTDAGGSGLASVQLWVKVDTGSWTQVGQFAAGAASGGTYSGTATYAAIVDGNAHTYAFYSVGVDGNQNVEAAPGSPDASVSTTFSVPSTWDVSKLTLNKNGQLTQRSYVRYLDVTLNQPLGVSDSVSLSLRWKGLDGNASGSDVSLATLMTGDTREFGGVGGFRNPRNHELRQRTDRYQAGRHRAAQLALGRWLLRVGRQREQHGRQEPALLSAVGGYEFRSQG